MTFNNGAAAIPMEPSPLHRAFDNYVHMEQQLKEITEKNQQLLVTNMNLLAEVKMMREALERADTDRIRLQAVSSQLLGRLLAINAVIGDAVKASIKHGIEAVEEVDRKQASGDVAEAAQRVAPVPATPVAPIGKPTSEAAAAVPAVNWP